MYKTSQFPRLFISSLLFLLIGCTPPPKMLFDKPGLTIEEFNRDKYECVQQSRVEWSGGGSGGLGVVMIFSAKSQADKQATEFFKMCMEARGYTAREVDNEEFERQQNSPIKTPLNEIVKDLNKLCNREDYKLIFVKSACKPNDITFEQLTDKTMISEVDKTVFSKYRSELQDLNNRLQEAIRTYGGPKETEEGLVLDRTHLQIDKSALDLFAGKITWGEYNKYRKEIYRTEMEELNRISNKK